MASQPFKFRHIDRIAGAFLFLTAIILAIMATLAAKSQRWFAETTEYRVEMPGGQAGDPKEEGTLGIKPGSDVRVVGSQVGHVKRVDLFLGEDLIPIHSLAEVDPNDIRIVAILRVKGDFAKFIGPDSRAVLKYDLGGLGSAYFDITRGSERFEENSHGKDSRILTFSKQMDAKQEVFEVVARIENELVPAIRSYRNMADTTKALVEKLSRDDEALFRLLTSLESGVSDLNLIMARVESGEGALGDMTSQSSEMRTQLNEFAVTLNQSSQDLSDAINNLDQGITNLRNEGGRSLNQAMNHLPGTVNRTDGAIAEFNTAATDLQETIREIEILTEALQRHWLVRRYIDDPVEGEYGSSRESENKPAGTNRSSSSDAGKKPGGKFQGGLKK